MSKVKNSKKGGKQEKAPDKPKNIHQALNAAMHECGYVQKTGQVSFGGIRYTYAGEPDLIQAIRPALTKHGVSFHCSNIELIAQERVITKRGNSSVEIYRALGRFTFVFSHGVSDTSVPVMALGEGHDSGDKAVYKAMTGALKYALRQTLVIETGDDPDKQASPPPEPIVVDPDLMQGAEDSASQGVDALKEFWGSLDQENIKQLLPHKANLYRRAKKADELIEANQ